MELEGVVQNGVVVPDDAAALPEDGTRVRIEPVPKPAPPAEKPEQPEQFKTFGESFAEFCGVLTGLPEDFAAQHDHYRLGVPKR